jgi:hypothetical protein
VRAIARKDGSAAYEVRWRQAGRFKQRTFKVKREAERFALRVEDEVEQGNSTDIYVRRSTTVRDVVEASMKASQPRLKPRTFASYRQSYDNHVLPALGHRRVSSVTSQEVEAWVQSLTARGLSPATVRNNFVALTKVFKYALRHDLVTKVQADEVPLLLHGLFEQPPKVHGGAGYPVKLRHDEDVGLSRLQQARGSLDARAVEVAAGVARVLDDLHVPPSAVGLSQ